MRKLCSLFAALSALCLTFCAFASTPLKASASATAEIAMELGTGTVLEEGNADLKLPMASTTKILTAIIIIEDCDLDEVITVPDGAVGVEGSSIYLQKGEQIDVRDLLYGLMLRSGNDSATALALHHSGSVEKFAAVMCERAKKYGAENSNFTNPSGLPDDNHYTTARDLCNIARHAMQNETFKKIVSTKNYSGKYKSFVNKNKMLSTCEGANGVKTGYTLKAGRCLVSSCEREGMDIICVVLNCPDMYEHSKAVFDRCFDGYELVKIEENRVFMSDIVLCKPAKSHSFVAKKDEKLKYVVIPADGETDEGGNKIVAKLQIFGGNGLIFCTDLYSI